MSCMGGTADGVSYAEIHKTNIAHEQFCVSVNILNFVTIYGNIQSRDTKFITKSVRFMII